MVVIILQIVVSLLLIGAVLLQMQGGGISAAFGGNAQFYRSKRSLEKILMWSTVVLGFIFAILSILLLLPQA